jgi:hypothetical protein
MVTGGHRTRHLASARSGCGPYLGDVLDGQVRAYHGLPVIADLLLDVDGIASLGVELQDGPV